MGMPYSRQNFLMKLEQGKKTEDYVAQKLREAGIEVEQPVYPEGMPRSYYTKNQVDMVANGYILEIKGSRYTFNSVADFTYPTRFIEGVSGFEAKLNVPEYYVNVSNPTGAIVALNVELTRADWKVEHITDRTRNYSYDMYLCDSKLWMDFDDFVKEIKNAKH